MIRLKDQNAQREINISNERNIPTNEKSKLNVSLYCNLHDPKVTLKMWYNDDFWLKSNQKKNFC